MNILSTASAQEHQYRECMAICASRSSSQYNSPNLSESWPSNNLQSPSSDTGLSDYQWTQTSNRSSFDFPNENPVFQYAASMPWPGPQMQHEWPSVANEYNKKRRSTKRKEQNRNAQRAFRERKEKHAKNLERRVATLTEELQMLRLAYKKLRQSRTIDTEDDELRDEVEAKPDPAGPHIDDWDTSLDDIICFDMT